MHLEIEITAGFPNLGSLSRSAGKSYSGMKSLSETCRDDKPPHHLFACWFFLVASYLLCWQLKLLGYEDTYAYLKTYNVQTQDARLFIGF